MKKNVILFATGLMLLLSACNQPKTSDQQTPTTENEVSATKVEMKDFGAEPFVFDIEAYTLQNETYRTGIWTGKYMQMTVMSLKPGEDIGLELHTDIDQFIRVEKGKGTVYMGDTQDNLNFTREVKEDFAFFIPAGKWHNLVNDSDETLKLYSIYAPVEHPHSTVHATKADGGEPHVH